MTTAPFSASAAELLPQTHEETFRAVAVLSTGTELPLDVVDWSIDWDETRSPRVQAQLVCAPPTDQATLDQLDPRLYVRVRIFAGYRLASGTLDEQQVAILGLRNRRLRRSGEGDVSMVLELSGKEAYFIEAATINPSAPQENLFNATSLAAAVQQYVTDLFAGTPLAGSTVTELYRTGPVGVPIYPNPWDALADICDELDAAIYDPGDGNFVVAQRSYQTEPNASVSLTVGANGNLLDSDAGISRDDWANLVIVWYKWRDAAGVEQEAASSRWVNTGPFSVTAAGYKEYLEVRDGVVGTNAKAYSVAGTILRRFLARSRSYTVEAVPAWWVRPGQTVTLQLPLGSQERHLVSRVGFTPGRMRVETRLPDTASTIGE